MKITLEINDEDGMKKVLDLFKGLLNESPEKREEPSDDYLREIYDDLFEYSEGEKLTVNEAKEALSAWLSFHPEMTRKFDYRKDGDKVDLTLMNSTKNKRFVNFVRSKGHEWNKVCRLTFPDGHSTTAKCVTDIKLKR